MVLGVLAAGIYYAVTLPAESESAILNQFGLRARVAASAPSPVARPVEEPTVEEDPAALGETAAVAPPLGTRFHTVESGDTLFTLAQRYGSTVDALVAANNLPNRNEPLRVGARLTIPPR